MKRFKNNISPDSNIKNIYKQKASPRAKRERLFCMKMFLLWLHVLLLHQHFDGLVAYLDDCHRTRQTRSA